MSTVNSHAALTPTTSTPNSHDCGVGAFISGRQRYTKAYAAATDTTSCMNRMPHYSEPGP